MTRCGLKKPCPVEDLPGGVLCCGKIRAHPKAFCVYCGCSWGSPASYSYARNAASWRAHIERAKATAGPQK